MALAIETKRQIFSTNQRHKTDTGSPEVQIALLSKRISLLTEHFATHKKDHGSQASPASDVPARYRSGALQSSTAAFGNSPLVHSPEAHPRPDSGRRLPN